MNGFRRRGLLRMLALFCVLVVTVSSPLPTVYASEAASSSTGETAKEKYERLKEELAQISGAIEQAQADKAAAEELLGSFQAEQQVILSMIAVNEQEIAETEARLYEKQDELAKIRSELYNNDQLYQKRLVAIYEMNNANVLAQVLSSESFTEFTQVVDAMQRISENDTELLRAQATNKSEIEAQEADIQTEIDTLNQIHAELAANNQALEYNQANQRALITEAESREADLEQAHEDTNAALEQAQKEMAAEQARIAQAGTQQGDGSIYVGGVFTWPVPGYYNISCYFGAPDPNGAGHRGMDIPTGGQIGPEIVACGAGTVITAASHSSYGNYIVIDHGDGVKTLYAHCSALLKGVGEYVETGTPIAQVGSTGFSTGPHLHLEVQTGSGLQDPLNYLR